MLILECFLYPANVQYPASLPFPCEWRHASGLIPIDAHLLNLLGQLAGRGQNQDLRLPDVGVNGLERYHGNGGSLARARLGLGDHVAPAQNRHDGALLNG